MREVTFIANDDNEYVVDYDECGGIKLAELILCLNAQIQGDCK